MAILAVVVLCNCNPVEEIKNAIDKLTKFDLDYETSYTIPAVSIINFPVSLNTPGVNTNNETTFENNNTNKNSVESIRLKSMSLNINTPENANFNFLKEIRIYIKTPNVEEIEIANLIDIENLDSNKLELDVLDEELRAYIKEDEFTLRVRAIADEITSEERQITIKTIFAVDAKVLGI